MKTTWSKQWPVLRTYDPDHLARIALPLGGIGTGTVSLGGRGDLRDWEIMNRPAKGFIPRTGPQFGVGPFFALRVQPPRGPAVVRALEGPLELETYEASHGATAANHGLPRFRRATFAAAYPLGQVALHDPAVPVGVRIEAFNPLVPGDSVASGIPVAVLRYVLTNPTRQALRASIVGTIPNFIGINGPRSDQNRAAKANRNRYRDRGGVRGIFLDSRGVDRDDEAWGTLALTTTARGGISYRTAWAQLSWGDSLLEFWDDFSADGRLENHRATNQEQPLASLAVAINLPARRARTVTFLVTWHFPNRVTWTPDKEACCARENIVGNEYTTRYRDAWQVAEQTARALPQLERKTIQFVDALVESDLPPVITEAALFNVANLRSQTCFRTADGHFFGWEGCGDTRGCCHGSCTHVWNYEQATGFLFADLARSARELEFRHATRADGRMSFRINLPLDRAAQFNGAAADGQMGAIMRLYREWTLSGDTDWLRGLWPQAKRALAFCWINGGWDADRDGVMEGCQHNTMDVEYFGPNPQMESWYLGALRAMEEMARHLGDETFAAECRKLFARGRAWTEAHLFNGDYYEHQIRPTAKIADGLSVGMGAKNLRDPELQLGAGCLVDQLVGQFTAHVVGLGYLLDRRQVRRTLRSIFRHNFRRGFHDHFNHLRSFVLGDESALLMATYPRGRRPRRPFPYYNEVMTGFEYTAAVHMLYEGLTREALTVIGAIRDRYDGRKRSPFNEAECGHHYVRAMASWAAVPAWTGFQWDGVSGTMRFAAKPGRWFWSTGQAWGTCVIRPHRGGFRARVNVLHGRLRIKAVRVGEPNDPRLQTA